MLTSKLLINIGLPILKFKEIQQSTALIVCLKSVVLSKMYLQKTVSKLIILTLCKLKAPLRTFSLPSRFSNNFIES